MMMKNTGPILIKLLIFAVFLSLGSCIQGKQPNSDTSKEQKQQAKVKKKNPAKKQAHKVIPLTDANAESQLLKYGKENPETLVLLKTSKGNMTIKLYENTPLHRANFIRLIKNHFYKGTVFYRVVKDFMIQGGDNDDWSRKSLKDKMGKYTIPAEIRVENIHQKGAVSMARDYENNPDMRSVSFDFFIVEGTKYNKAELLGAEQQYGLHISPEHKKIYETIGGTPHLDGKHTVFGQVIDGLNVIDSIAAVKVDEGNWPIDDITMEFQIIK